MTRTVPSLSGARVLIWGAGSHGGGMAAAMHCHRAGAQVAILDQCAPRSRPEAASLAASMGWPWYCGEQRHPVLRRSDLLVISPAIPPAAVARLPAGHPPLLPAEALFFATHRGPRIVVTGTKGKSTTAATLACLLDWPVAGNSHEPLLDLLQRSGPEVPVICELSSFQIHWLSELAPRFEMAVLTSLDLDHLHWHGDADSYRSCKLQALRWATLVATPAACRQHVPAEATWLPPLDCTDGYFRCPDTAPLAPREAFAPPGHHNAVNAGLALAVALHGGLDPAMLAIRLHQVPVLPHRLQSVHSADGLHFVDDSIATTPVATLAALQAIDGPLAIILGGADKGSDLHAVAAAVATRGAQAVTTGSTGPHLAGLLARHAVDAHYVPELAQAVSLARDLLPEGGTVLLSPACASTDAWPDFAARGEAFAAAARALPPRGLP